MNFETPLNGLGHGWLPLGRLDPAHKLTAALMFAVGVSLLRSPWQAGLACLMPLALIALARLPLALIGRRLAALNIFFLLIWVLLPCALSAPEEDVLTRMGPLIVRASAVELAALITLKGNAIAAMLMILAGTSGLMANGHALLRLHVPPKLVTLLLLTCANLDMMRKECRRLFDAARLRGFVPRTSLAAYKTCAYLAAMLLVRSWMRARRVEQAMKLRGFCGRFVLFETELSEYKPQGVALVAIIVLFAAVLLTMDFGLPHA